MAVSYNEIVKPVKVEGKMAVPRARTTEVAAGLDMNTFLLISLLDKDGTSSSLKDLLPIILMSQGGAGMGGDLLSNPLLLMTLLDDDSKIDSDLILIMTLMNGGGLGGSTDLLGSPLLLMTLLKDDTSSSMKDLLPLLLLLDDNSTDISDLLLIMMVSGGGLGGAGGAA